MSDLDRALVDLSLQRDCVINAIIRAAALAFGITPEDITARGRQKSVAEARCCVCYVARRCTRMSFPQIGKALGRDHTSVMSAVKRVEVMRFRSEWFAAAVKVLVERFGEIQEIAAE